MPGLWERLAGGQPGRLDGSDCESLGSASGSEGEPEDAADEASLPDLELLHDPEDELLCANLLAVVRATLGRAPLGTRRPSRLLMPEQLAAQVGTELLRLACSEPCGLRGALLDLCVEHGKVCHDVGHIAVDPAVVPTFQLTLVLRLDSRLWPKIQGLFASAPAFAPGFGQSLKLSTGFRVIKKKLYSSEQLLVEEC
ncbi:DNA damage-inducible transcript 4 protein [Struthio camelus]|uniref:DNA damage-inducible transcript 4 protein n=1 Tax=Struthio camelus TaxID=8801 RepID=UPI003603E7F0